MAASVAALPRTSAERITVGLTRRVSQELSDMSDETGMSKTDLVNRAISLYRLITGKTDNGYQLALIGRDGEAEIIHIL